MLLVSDLLELARGRAPQPPPTEAGRGRYGTPTGPVVVWNVINHCNMTCPHCYAAAVKKPDPQDLTFEEGKKLLDELKTLGCPAIIFSGGEPLLRHDLLDLIRYAKSIGHRPQVSSNGVMITDKTAQELADAGVEYVGISVDGMPEFNDGYRGYDRAFERAFRAAQACMDRGMKVGIRMTVSKKNRDQIGPLLNHVCALRIPRFYLSHLVYAGRAHEDHAYDLSPAETRKLVLDLFAKAESLLDAQSATRIVLGANDSNGPLLYFYVLQNHGELAARRVLERLKARHGNTAGEKVLSIDNRGSVHPDQFWAEAALGNVRHQPLEQILRHPLLDQLRRREQYLEGRCGSCAFKAACRGSHRERALAAGGSLWSPDPSCCLTDAETRGELVEWSRAATSLG